MAENLREIGTDPTGVTVLVTESNIRLELTPKASQELLDHLLRASTVEATIKGVTRRGTLRQNPYTGRISVEP